MDVGVSSHLGPCVMFVKSVEAKGKIFAYFVYVVLAHSFKQNLNLDSTKLDYHDFKTIADCSQDYENFQK
jgi:hypothetical protein